MKNNRQKLFLTIKSYFIITIGLIVQTVGVYFFKIPNGFVTGGVAGVGTVLGKIFGIFSPSIWISLLNLTLLFIGFIFLGRDTGIKTVYGSILFSFLNLFYEKVLPINSTLTDNPLLELIYAIMLTGIGSAIIFSQSGSSGGTDIVALILKKHTNLNVGRALLYTDFFVTVSSFFTFGIKTGLFSLLGLFAKAFLVDGIIESIHSCKYFAVITDKPEEIKKYIINELHHGVTSHRVIGEFSGDDKTMLHTVCHRIDAIRLKRKAMEVDPHSFTVVTTTSEIIGRGFRSV